MQTLKNAWKNPGPNPAYHEMMKRKLKLEWPTLYYAIEDILNNQDQ